MPHLFIFTRTEYLIERVFEDKGLGKRFLKPLDKNNWVYSMGVKDRCLDLETYDPNKRIHFCWDGVIDGFEEGTYPIRLGSAILDFFEQRLIHNAKNNGTYLLLHQKPEGVFREEINKFDFGKAPKYRTIIFDKGLHSKGNKFYGTIIKIVEQNIELSDISYEEVVENIFDGFDFDFDLETKAAF